MNPGGDLVHTLLLICLRLQHPIILLSYSSAAASRQRADQSISHLFFKSGDLLVLR